MRRCCTRVLQRTSSRPLCVDRLYSTEAARDLSHKFVEKGSVFNDHVFVKTVAGRGGDGCVSFLREKFLPKGPPNGGSGGSGGDVYIMAVDGENSLSTPQLVKSDPGQGGRGSSMNGKKGEDVVIRVPVGTVLRELEMPERMMQRGGQTEEVSPWVHYPRAEEDNLASERIRAAEKTLRTHQRKTQPSFKNRHATVTRLELDLDRPTPANKPILLCRGGVGGFGNTFFMTADNRSPKFASRGVVGEEKYFELELKTLANVGLVGLPNAGKSTFLGAISNAKPRVGHWAFTTLTPYLGTISDNERQFTVADIPGIIRGASEDKGLGHDFLRHIERAEILAFVIDLSNDPVSDYMTLLAELRAYSTDLEGRQTVIIGNKADMEGTKEGLENLRKKVDAVWHARCEAGLQGNLQKPMVIPLSSKDQMGVKQAVGILRSLVDLQAQYKINQQQAHPTEDEIFVVQG